MIAFLFQLNLFPKITVTFQAARLQVPSNQPAQFYPRAPLASGTSL
jgi:hypothetical protein